jgi:hypothetical protein
LLLQRRCLQVPCAHLLLLHLLLHVVLLCAWSRPAAAVLYAAAAALPLLLPLLLPRPQDMELLLG